MPDCLAQAPHRRWGDPRLGQPTHPQKIRQVPRVAFVVLDPPVGEALDSQRMRQVNAGTGGGHVGGPVLRGRRRVAAPPPPRNRASELSPHPARASPNGCWQVVPVGLGSSANARPSTERGQLGRSVICRRVARTPFGCWIADHGGHGYPPLFSNVTQARRR